MWVVPKFVPQIQNGGRPPFKKRVNCYILATVPPIFTKFCMLTHIGPPNPERFSKNQILKMQDGRRPSFWKLLNAISQQPWPILIQFGTTMHIRHPKMTGEQYLKILKSKMTNGGHLKNQKSRYLQNRLAILMKFCTMTHISPEITGCSKISWQLSIPATSVEAERAFSAAGVLCTKLRSQLADNSIDTMCFLRSYYMKHRTCN